MVTGVVVPIGQLSAATGVKVTIAPHWFTVLLTVMFAGQVIVGACVSFTVTVKVQVAPVVVDTFTVVVPIGKKEPDAGVDVTVPHPAEAVGAGYVTIAPH